MSKTLPALIVDGQFLGYFPPSNAEQIEYKNGETVKEALDEKVSDNPTFTEAQTRVNIASGETFATILGKIKKWFTDLPSMFVSKSDGGTFGGNVGADAQNGTTSEDGYTYIIVGNDIAQGTNKNSTGVLRLYGNGTNYTEIYAPNSTAFRLITLPNKNGTIALTNDITSYSVTKATGSGDSITVNISKWSRYGIAIFGNGNSASIYGTILIDGSNYGYVDTPITVFKDDIPIQLTVTKNEGDSITVSGLPIWGYYTLLSPYPIS